MRQPLTAGDFAGDWVLLRDITDRRAAQAGGFDGHAHFALTAPDRLSYVEEGMLRLGTGPVMTTSRAYHWAFDAARITVTFADSRPFHSFPCAGGPGEDHPCGADLYRVTYDFARWPVWETTWTVCGPRKDYTMTSRYHPR